MWADTARRYDIATRHLLDVQNTIGWGNGFIQFVAKVSCVKIYPPISFRYVTFPHIRSEGSISDTWVCPLYLRRGCFHLYWLSEAVLVELCH